MKKALLSLLLSLALFTPAQANIRQMGSFKTPITSSWTFADVNSTNFTASNQNISITDPANYRFVYNAAFSVSAWIKNAIATNNYGNIAGRCQPTGQFTGWEFSVLNQVVDFWFAVDVTHYLEARQTTAQFVNGTWYNVIMTYSGSGLASGVHFYVNGVNKAFTTVNDALGTGNTVAASLNAYIGGTIFGAWYQGKIDDETIWNVELTSGNATTIYNSGHNADARNFSFAANLIGYYPLGDSDDATTSSGYNDRSGSGYHGTGANMTNATNIVADAP